MARRILIVLASLAALPASAQQASQPVRLRLANSLCTSMTGAVLTSQLYFPDARRNATDSIFNAALMVAMQDAADGKVGTFDFVVRAE